MFSELRHEVESLDLVPSSGGAFEVYKNGEKIYSKLDAGTFPKVENIIKKLKD
nr:SelT/SelW/SelH family protein [Alkalicoccus halolimnae]